MRGRARLRLMRWCSQATLRRQLQADMREMRRMDDHTSSCSMAGGVGEHHQQPHLHVAVKHCMLLPLLPSGMVQLCAQRDQGPTQHFSLAA